MSSQYWFFMRAAYGKEAVARDYLEKNGIKVYHPQHVIKKVEGDRTYMSVQSIIPNSLFVFSTEEILKQYVGQPPLDFFHHYYIPNLDEKGVPIENGRKPIVIPDNQMEQFIIWNDAKDANKYFRQEEYTFVPGQRVYVKEGPFKGFTGQVVRIKGQTRVGTNITSVGFIATTYIPKHFLVAIEEENNKINK